MTVSSHNQEVFFTKTFFKEYAIGLAITLYPACKIKKLCDFVFSDDNQTTETSIEDRRAMQAISIATSAMGSLYIAYFAQKVLALLRNRKIRPNLVALAIVLPLLVDKYPALKEKLKTYKFHEVDSNLVAGSIAVVTFVAASTLAKKVL